MNATGLKTSLELRAWFKKKIEENAIKDTETLYEIENDTSLIKEYRDYYFGLERLSLAQKFATIGRNDMVIECLKQSACTINYTSINDKNILDYFKDDDDIFKEILKYTKDIPSELMSKDPKYMTEKEKWHTEIIKLENSIINCAKNDCNEARMNINAKKFGILTDDYSRRVSEKKYLI